MKKLLFLFILAPFFTSCNKREKDKKVCNGWFIGGSTWAHGSSTLAAYSASTGNIIKQWGPPFEFRGLFLAKAYNSNTKEYYRLENDNGLQLHKCNLASTSLETYGYNGPIISGDKTLLVNSNSGKLYLLVSNDTLQNFFELQLTIETRPPSAHFTVKELYSTNKLHPVTFPFIDEGNGLIYFMYGNELRKFDPANGASAVVTTYSDVLPEELYYNGNDKMVYGIDKKTSPFSFIRLKPANGSVTKISQLPFIDTNYSIGHTYDPCNDQYVLSAYTNIYFIAPNKGEVVKQLSNTGIGFHNSPYIEQ